jgi:hypothetical protein
MFVPEFPINPFEGIVDPFFYAFPLGVKVFQSAEVFHPRSLFGAGYNFQLVLRGFSHKLSE